MNTPVLIAGYGLFAACCARVVWIMLLARAESKVQPTRKESR